MIYGFPSFLDAPAYLQRLEGNCGPMSLWLVSKHLGIRVAARRLIELCRHTRENGTFTIWIAIALHRLGAHVTFSTDFDESRMPLEQVGYDHAEKLKIDIVPSLSLSDLLKIANRGVIPIVYYFGGISGHFSPLLGVHRGEIVLANDAWIKRDEFEKRRFTDGHLGQCVLVQAGPLRKGRRP